MNKLISEINQFIADVIIHPWCKFQMPKAYSSWNTTVRAKGGGVKIQNFQKTQFEIKVMVNSQLQSNLTAIFSKYTKFSHHVFQLFFSH